MPERYATRRSPCPTGHRMTRSVTHQPRRPSEPNHDRRSRDGDLLPTAEQGELERAARLLGAAIEFFEEAGVTRQRTDKECERAALQAMRDRLDEQTVQTLIHVGRSKPLEQVAKLELKPD
jgi:LmbE family N-acetylglucosaminyl deacetylase